MSQQKGKTNFRTYEAATRLLAAVIATTGAKLDYNEIAKHVGGGVGVDAINHRFRPIKQLAKMQAECVKKGEDPGELPTEKGALAANYGADATAVGLQHRLRPMIQLAKLQLDYRKKGKDPGELPTEKGGESPRFLTLHRRLTHTLQLSKAFEHRAIPHNFTFHHPPQIQKLFGESTPKGIEWQFRDIKSLGKAQQEAVKKGENPAAVLTPGTPSANRGRKSAATPGSGATARTPGTGTGTGRKRKTLPTIPALDSSDENGGADDNDSDFVETPSNRPSKRAATASTKKASGSQSTPIATSANSITGTPNPTMTSGLAPIPMPRASIFGGGARAPNVVQSTESFNDDIQISGSFDTQSHDLTPRPASKLATIKKELAVSANSFVSSVNSFNSGGYYGEEYDDGEV
ncbi:hypothetical protein F4860DRAFT_509199 [Xylaria cubensis]|nr:hypothetical protein F4860DRAFT_509199 [Xylaria cubensis]